MDFVVGTFNTPELFTLRFHVPEEGQTNGSLELRRSSPAIGSHSWLALSHDRRHLYATAWTEPPSVAAYRLEDGVPTLLNNKPVKARSGYVCVSQTHLYSAGGPTGEVYSLSQDGSINTLVQQLSFVQDEQTHDHGSAVPHGDFGGLRHGAHSADLSPDGKSLYIADIGRNCIWTYSVSQTESDSHLVLGSKHISPRSHDGPRHATVHPNNRTLYCLQEHSSMVDVFEIAADGTTLSHIDEVNIIPESRDPSLYWADEVRVSTLRGDETAPKFLYASTRGLEAQTKGYVAVFALDRQGRLASNTPLDIFKTATSGGWANAVEPAPRSQYSGSIEYLAMPENEEGIVFVLSFDGQRIREAARLELGQWEGNVRGAATAVWL